MLRQKGIKPTIRPPNHLVAKRAKLSVSITLPINKLKGIMHRGIKINMVEWSL
ncbi:MAG: hypothetical protein AB8B66_04475 [Rickettsiaceae bacterium]